MASSLEAKDGEFSDMPLHQGETPKPITSPGDKKPRWKRLLGMRKETTDLPSVGTMSSEEDDTEKGTRPEKWSMGVLNDRETEEVPGSIILMSKTNRNEPLGLRNAPARTSASSLPSPFPPGSRPSSQRPPFGRRLSEQSVEKKRTPDGKIILHPQPEDSMNDPLNWPSWRRDIALLSLGFYSMLGGGMTPVLAAGFNKVADQYGVSIPKVALTTGLYMMGLGLGSVVASPTAILFGKRPVYLVGTLLFVVSAIWCALSPNYASLVVARVVMGFAVSPIECLPSATIAEIFYLHERAYRLGIYTLLLLSGKNLIPLVSAAIIEGLDWQWVFWIVAVVVGFCFGLTFLFLPETFWDRTPRPHSKARKQGLASLSRIFTPTQHGDKAQIPASADNSLDMRKLAIGNSSAGTDHATIAERRRQKREQHVGFADQAREATGVKNEDVVMHEKVSFDENNVAVSTSASNTLEDVETMERRSTSPGLSPPLNLIVQNEAARVQPGTGTDYIKDEHETPGEDVETPGSARSDLEIPASGGPRYTHDLRTQPPKTYLQSLRPWNGRLCNESWLLVAFRPFILYAYPSILWSTLVYSLSIGWLIVLSESVSSIYENKESYNFTALQTGLVYVSPFLGGVLGTAVAGKVSDIIVRFMSRRNGGVYEPEFRLVMAIPVTVATCIGLMGFGWSAQEKDQWIVPTVFFGIISFGCALGSTTAITFAVDSYRQYAGEALVTLNFSKNIFHGLVFSLFFNKWLDADGSKNTFLAVGGIQLACLATTVPMYVYGKRARMWTVRKNFMEKF